MPAAVFAWCEPDLTDFIEKYRAPVGKLKTPILRASLRISAFGMPEELTFDQLWCKRCTIHFHKQVLVAGT